MRWFKHMTIAGDDEKLCMLTDAYGLEGYGFWWRVLEIVAEKVDENGGTSLSYSAQKWSGMLGIRSDKFRRMAEKCAGLGLFRLDSHGTYIEIDIPNLLKFRDEYSKKSGRAQDKLRSKIQIQNLDPDPDPEKEPPVAPRGGADAQAIRSGERPTFPPVAPRGGADAQSAALGRTEAERALPGFADDFADFWRIYPKKTGKKAALQAWKSAKDKPPPAVLLEAVKKQKTWPEWRRDEGRYIPNPATWLNQGRWNDEAPVACDGSPAPLSPEERARRDAECERILAQMRRKARGGLQ